LVLSSHVKVTTSDWFSTPQASISPVLLRNSEVHFTKWDTWGNWFWASRNSNCINTNVTGDIFRGCCPKNFSRGFRKPFDEVGTWVAPIRIWVSKNPNLGMDQPNHQIRKFRRQWCQICRKGLDLTRIMLRKFTEH
jgi:hypothetical protein